MTATHLFLIAIFILQLATGSEPEKPRHYLAAFSACLIFLGALALSILAAI
jgi:hypothetical protein